MEAMQETTGRRQPDAVAFSPCRAVAYGQRRPLFTAGARGQGTGNEKAASAPPSGTFGREGSSPVTRWRSASPRPSFAHRLPGYSVTSGPVSEHLSSDTHSPFPPRVRGWRKGPPSPRRGNADSERALVRVLSGHVPRSCLRASSLTRAQLC